LSFLKTKPQGFELYLVEVMAKTQIPIDLTVSRTRYKDQPKTFREYAGCYEQQLRGEEL